MSNFIPDGWEQSKLGKYIGIQGGNAFKSDAFAESGVPVVRISNIKKDGSINLKGSIFAHEHESLTRFKVQYGDILIAMSGATTGKVGRYNLNNHSYLNQRVGRFFAKNSDLVSMDYVHQITAKDSFVLSILIDAIGGAQPNISNQQIESITAFFPPLPEQQKIAAILTSVDDVIKKTQAQIDKLKDLKTGMMQELLTRGVGVDGKPHTEFKDSPVGRIPKGWDVVTADSVSEAVMVGVVVKPTQYYVESGIPALRSANVRESGLTLLNLKFFSSESNEVLKKSKLQLGDLLTVRTGYPGTTAVVTEDFVGANCIDVVITRPSKQIDSNYFCMWVNSDNGKGQVLKVQGGLAQQHFNVGDMKNLLIALPSIQEQICIFNVVQAITDKTKVAEAKLKKLTDTKKALMQDLLTGKVRVKVDS